MCNLTPLPLISPPPPFYLPPSPPSLPLSLLPSQHILQFFAQLVVAIQHVHSLNILHRDLKTQNIMLNHKKTVLKMGDFGISKVLSSKITSAQTVWRCCLNLIPKPHAWGLGMRLLLPSIRILNMLVCRCIQAMDIITSSPSFLPPSLLPSFPPSLPRFLRPPSLPSPSLPPSLPPSCIDCRNSQLHLSRNL